MRITERQLRQIIRETVIDLYENMGPRTPEDQVADALKDILLDPKYKEKENREELAKHLTQMFPKLLWDKNTTTQRVLDNLWGKHEYIANELRSLQVI